MILNDFKKNNSKEPLITIVTVVFDGEKDIEKTILSVINQTYKNIEYIIIDGASTDKTVDIIQKYENKIDQWFSEKDRGIYDAMNKAIDIAKGEWINFMNVGDTFNKSNVLEVLFEGQLFEDIDIIYGNHQIVYPSGRSRLAKAGLIENIDKGSQFCHQSSFIRTKYHKVNTFNILTKIAADFEFFYNSRKNGAIFKFVDLIICKFQAGGVSDVKRVESILSQWSIIDKTLKNNLYYSYLVIRETIKSNRFVLFFLNKFR